MTYVGERRETERLVTDLEVRHAMHRVIGKPASWVLWLKYLEAAPAVQGRVRQELASRYAAVPLCGIIREVGCESS